VDVAGEPVPTLAGPQLVLYLAGHGGRHAWNRGAWVLDFAQLSCASPALDWMEIAESARACGRERALLLALRVVHEALAVPPPPALADRVAGDSVVRDVARVAIANLTDPGVLTARLWMLQLYQIRLVERLRERIPFAAWVILTPNRFDWRVVSLPPRLSWVYSVIKPIRLAWRVSAIIGRRILERLGRGDPLKATRDAPTIQR